MNKKIFLHRISKHPLAALYGTLLGLVAFSAALPIFESGLWDAALVDLAMGGILIALMLKNFIFTFRKNSTVIEKSAAWGVLLIADILALLPTGEFPGSFAAALAVTLLICAFVLYFSGSFMALNCLAPALWCCVFMPYHEEIMLLLSFPLRLSATALSGTVLDLYGIDVIYSGTSLALPHLNIAITDACSGINQLDAFILIAFVAVQMLHKNLLWKILHFAFIIPAMIIGNTLRIVITVLLFCRFGEAVLDNSWHIALGYVQIFFAFIIFLVIGRIFRWGSEKKGEIRK
jgi:exosortase